MTVDFRRRASELHHWHLWFAGAAYLKQGHNFGACAAPRQRHPTPPLRGITTEAHRSSHLGDLSLVPGRVPVLLSTKEARQLPLVEAFEYSPNGCPG